MRHLSTKIMKQNKQESLISLIQEAYSLIEKHPDFEEKYDTIVSNSRSHEEVINKLESLVNEYHNNNKKSRVYLSPIDLYNTDEINKLKEFRINFLEEILKFNPKLKQEPSQYELSSSETLLYELDSLDEFFESYFIVKEIKCNDEIKKDITGYLLCNQDQENQIELAEIYVSPEFRREGIAKSAVKEAINLYTKLGYNLIALVHKGNKNPQRLLIDLGFEKRSEVDSCLIEFVYDKNLRKI
ncbi:MAG: FR47-like protein [Candidatus Woesearchaeota archaeon]|nr:FR47-like protein [Candidatus Woesearchaeota archaeon]